MHAVASKLGQDVNFVLGFCALAQDRFPVALDQSKERPQAGLCLLVFGNILQERAVQFDFFERKILEVAEGRISGSEIIQRPGYAKRLQGAHSVDSFTVRAKKFGFGEFKAKLIRRKIIAVQQCRNLIWEISR